MSGMSYDGFFSSPLWTHRYDHAHQPSSSSSHYQYDQQPYPYSYFQQPLQPFPVAFPQQRLLSTLPTPPIPVQSQPAHLSDDSSNQPIRRKRASKPKVRTGCTTCKIRRVKCDEARPNCLRCTSTGRKCDGYEFPRKDPPVATDSEAPAQTPPSSLPPPAQDVVNKSPAKKEPEIFVRPFVTTLNKAFEGSVQERRAFYRFKHQTIPAFAGGSETQFWTVLVPQAAVAEPVIRDAVIALGSLHEDYELRGGQYNQDVITSPSYRNATLLYGKAIRRLYTRIDSSPGETANLAIIASILFACFEVLRRNDMAAVIHYQAGMRQLMKQMNERSRPCLEVDSDDEIYPEAGTTMRSQPQDDLDQMLRVFARYDVQACTMSKPKAEVLNLQLPPAPANNVGMAEVRQYLDNLLIAVYQLLKSDLSMFRYWKTEDVSPSWHQRREEALTTFQGWLDVLEESLPSDLVTLRNHGVTASKSILGLILQVKIAMIMLRTAIDCGQETTFDKYKPDFEEMVSRVEHLTSTLRFGESLPLDRDCVPFSMELGIIHPLFFIAWKCRDWSLRRRAIAQLKKCGKEGVWEGPIMAVVAERICQIEEKNVRPGDTVPEFARIHDMRKGIQYDQRVVSAEIRLAQDATWKNWTVLREAIPF